MKYQYVLLCLLAFACNQPSKKNTTHAVVGSKSTTDFATGFYLQSSDSANIIEIVNPFAPREILSRYLVQHQGSNAEQLKKHGDIYFNSPPKKIAVQSTTISAFFSELNAQDLIIAACNANLFCDTVLYNKYKQGKITNLGGAQHVNPELIISLSPDVYIKYLYQAVEAEDNKIMRAGIPILYVTDYLEELPLGRAEWLKVIGALTGRRQQADSLFDVVKENYQHLIAGTTQQNAPKFLAGSNFKGTWYVPAGKSFVANLINHAGGTYFYSNDTNTGSLPIDFEHIVQNQRNVDIWIGANAYNLQELYQADNRYKAIEAFKNGHVYHFDKQKNPEGGLNYFEQGVVRPDFLLNDLKIIIDNWNKGGKPKNTRFYRKLQ